MEVRKGIMGLGPNLMQTTLDLSQTGVCVVVKAPMKRGDDAEVRRRAALLRRHRA